MVSLRPGEENSCNANIRARRRARGLRIRLVISLREVSLIYPNGTRALDGIDLEIAKGSFVFLVGHSGTGKSSLLRLLYREQKPSSGIGDDRRRARRYGKRSKVPKPLRCRKVGVVFQDFKLLGDKTIWENVAFALQVTGARTRDVMRQVPRVLDLVGLAHKSRVFPNELSGGEQQRAAIARALVNNPKILLCDEPSGNLDPVNTNEIMDLLHRINLKGTTVVVATHNALVVDRMRRRVIRLEHGKVLADDESAASTTSRQPPKRARSRAMPAQHGCAMDWGKIRFFLSEVWRNFTRNIIMQVTAIGTVTVMIVLLRNVPVRATDAGASRRRSDRENRDLGLHDRQGDAGRTQRALVLRLRSDPHVKSVTYVPKAEGLRQMRERLRGQIDTSLLTTNPLPDKLRVRVVDPESVHNVAARISKLPNVANVAYQRDAVEHLLRFSDVLGKVGLAFIVLLVLTAAIIISNTIRLTVYARRREIAIMQLVGASNIYIRLPFICEGFLDGLIGAVLAVLLLGIGRWQLWPKLLAALPFIPLRDAPVRSRHLRAATARRRRNRRDRRVVDLGRAIPAHMRANAYGRSPRSPLRCSGASARQALPRRGIPRHRRRSANASRSSSNRFERHEAETGGINAAVASAPDDLARSAESTARDQQQHIARQRRAQRSERRDSLHRTQA